MSDAGDSASLVPSETFWVLCQQADQMDELLSADQFDPAVFVEQLAGKVDGLQHIIERMEATAQWLKAQAEPIVRRANSMLRNRERLRAYVVDSMKLNNLEQLPGNVYKLRLRQATPKLTMEREAAPQDMQEFPQYVKMERRYTWMTEAIKEDMKTGKCPQGLPAKLTHGHWPEFVINVPEKLEPKKKSSSKSKKKEAS